MILISNVNILTQKFYFFVFLHLFSDVIFFHDSFMLIHHAIHSLIHLIHLVSHMVFIAPFIYLDSRLNNVYR